MNMNGSNKPEIKDWRQMSLAYIFLSSFFYFYLLARSMYVGSLFYFQKFY